MPAPLKRRLFLLRKRYDGYNLVLDYCSSGENETGLDGFFFFFAVVSRSLENNYGGGLFEEILWRNWNNELANEGLDPE